MLLGATLFFYFITRKSHNRRGLVDNLSTFFQRAHIKSQPSIGRFSKTKMTALRWSATLLLVVVGLTAGEIKNKGWWKNAVFYQVYPRSFKDSNGDGIGDIKGITEKLQHFKDSGITAIWLSPIFTSPMVDFGYDISDFKDIDGPYGTMKDLEELTKKAKEHGVKVVLDLVPNHSSDKHEWFQKSLKNEGKYADYYIWRKGQNDNSDPPNNWISVFSGSAWTFDSNRGLWYFHQFDYRQPDLNFANPAVKEEMEDVIKFWLKRGIDGFRIDAVPHLFEDDNLQDEPRSNAPGSTPHDYTYLNHIYTKDDPRTYELVKSWRNLVDDWANKNNLDEIVLLTEAYTSLENTTKFYEYGSHVPFNFNFIMTIDKNSKPKEYKDIIESWLKNTPEGCVGNWVMGNHDRSRVATRFPGRADQLVMLEMILPGVAVTYNGEEIGMEDNRTISWRDTQDPQACNAGEDTWQKQTRDPNRTPFQWDDTKNAGFSTGDHTWLPVHNNYKELNLKKQTNQNGSHYSIYQRLTALKKNSEVLKSGQLEIQVLNDNQVLAVIRKTTDQPTEKVMLVINFNDEQSQSLQLSNFTDSKIGKVYVSSEGSGIEWGKDVETLNLQSKASVVLITGKDSEIPKPNSGFLLTASTKVLLFAFFSIVYKLL